jgi:hypothetical protein
MKKQCKYNFKDQSSAFYPCLSQNYAHIVQFDAESLNLIMSASS